jgi:hypothetical protein
MAALLDGSLAITRNATSRVWCLAVVQGSHAVEPVAWPESFTLVLASDGKAEVHGAGHVFRQGEMVRFGGGEISDGLHHSNADGCDATTYFAVQTIP